MRISDSNLPVDASPFALSSASSPTPAPSPIPITPTDPWNPSGHPSRVPASQGSAPAGVTRGNNPPPTLSLNAQKIQALPLEQQDALLQQNEAIANRESSLQNNYPTVEKQSGQRMQTLVNQIYGDGHDVHGLYLNRYAIRHLAGHPSHDHPELEAPEGTVIRSIPLSQVLQTNMPSHTVFDNEYRGDGQEYKIVTAADRTQKHDAATGVLDPAKLYHGLDNVDFKSEQTTAIERYYDAHGSEIAQLAKDKALTQLDVQHYTGGLDQRDYESIKKVLSGQGGGKIYTLSTGTHTLAGGFRIELDSGKNFTYLSQESRSYQAFKSEGEALDAIRARGKDADSAQAFVQKYSSQAGDPGLEHGTDAAKELQQRYGDGLRKQAFNGRQVDSLQYSRLLRGNQFDITHDPFGELTRESKKNDLQDAKQGIKSNADITAEDVNEWGGVTGQIIADTVGVFAPEIAAAKFGNSAKIVEAAADVEKAGQKEATLGEAADSTPGARLATAGSSGTTKPIEGSGSRGNLSLIDEVAKATARDQRLAAYASGKTTKGLSPNKDGLYDIGRETYVPLGKHTADELTQGVPLFRIRQQESDFRLVKPKEMLPDFNAPYVQQGEDGAFSATRPGLKGGMDDQVPGPSRKRSGPAQPDPGPSKKPSNQQRTSARRQAARNYTDEQGNHPFVRPDGSVNMIGYHRHLREQTARNYADEQGKHIFVRHDGSVDIAAYDRHTKEQTARNYIDEQGKSPFVRPDGSVDITGYYRLAKHRAARNYTDEQGNHPFVRPDGSVDTAGYYGSTRERIARNYTDERGDHPFVRPDGSVDISAYRRHATQRAARNYTDEQGNHPFVRPDGSLNKSAYYRHRREQDARHYTDAQGKHPFVRRDNSVNVAGYNRYIKEQSARNYTDKQGNHPFVRPDGSADTTGYARFTRGRAARNYTDRQGNHPFVRPDGTTAERDYENFIRQAVAGDRQLTAEQQKTVDEFVDKVWLHMVKDQDRPVIPTAEELLEENNLPHTAEQQQAIDDFDVDQFDVEEFDVDAFDNEVRLRTIDEQDRPDTPTTEEMLEEFNN